MHKPLFVVSFYDVNSPERYIPEDEDIWNEVKHKYDCISPAEEDEWTEKHFVKALNNMFDGVVYDGNTYIIPKEAIKAYLEKMTEKVKQYLDEKPLTGKNINRWMNGLRYGIFEEGTHFIVDGSSEYGVGFASHLLYEEEGKEKVFANIKLESIYDAHC